MESNIDTEILEGHFQSAPYPVAVCDLVGNIIVCNPAYSSLHCDTQIARNRNGVKIVEYYRNELLPSQNAAIELENKNGLIQAPIELILTRDDETEFPAEVWISPLTGRQGKNSTILIYIRDLSDQKKTDNLLNAQKDLAVALSSANDLDFGLQLCVEAASAVSGMDSGGVYLVNNSTGSLDLVYEKGLHSDFVNRVSHFESNSANTRLVLDGKPIYKCYNELGIPLDEVKLSENLLATAIVPIKHGDNVIGCLNIASHTADSISANARFALETIAAQIGSALARLKAEKALAESEMQFRTLFEQSGEAIFLADSKANFIKINNSLCEQLGYTPDELLNMNVTAIIHPEDLATKPIRFSELAKGKTLNSERRLVRKNSTIFQAAFMARMLNDGTIIGIGRDVTSQRLYEKQLEMQAHMLDAVQQSVVASNQYGMITYFNEFAGRLFGWTKDEVLGKHLAKILRIDENESLLREIGDHLFQKNSWTGEISVKDKYGRDIPILATASPIFEGKTFIGTINVAFDITERKKIEAIQRENEEKYRATFENTGSASVLIEEDTTISLANMEFEHLSEYSKAEIEGKKSWTEFVVKEDLEKMLAQHRLRRENREQALTKYEFRLITKSGIIRNILLTIDVIPGTKNSIASLVDITERKQAEEALKLSEDKFAKAFRVSPAAISITRLIDGVIVDCNKSTEYLLGYPIEEINGLTTEQIGIWADIHDREHLKKMLLANEPVRNLETRFKAKDGSIKNIQLAAEIIELNNEPYMLATFIDLTEMKRAEEELLKSKLRYQELFESLLEGVALLDHNGTIKFCNPAFMNLHEADTMDILIERNIIDFVSDINSPAIKNTRELWEKGINSQTEIDIVTIKGNKKSILTSGMPKLDSNGILVHVIVTVIDITEFKRLKDLEFHAQRLEAAGKIAGQVAHDFNNLLGPAIAYPEIIKSCILKDDSIIGMLNDIEKSATAMAEINQQLLTLSRRGHYVQGVINLNNIVRQAIDQLDKHTNDIAIKQDLDASLMNIKGGSSQILRIISNLINNALDAMHNHGQLFIKTENYYAEEISNIFDRIPKGEYCKVTITDNGCGISEEIVPKIFDAFFTTKTADKKRGSGLGLSVVHAVMEDHCGHIDFQTRVGEGTSFYLYFPITRETIEEKKTENIRGGTESILVVDDDKLQREVIQSILKRLGYKVMAVESGEEALNFLKSNHPDLLIIDMIMPGGFDGTETYRRAIEINRSQQALIISGFAETNQVKEALRLGVGAFIKKPLSSKAIADAVRKELDRLKPAALKTIK